MEVPIILNFLILVFVFVSLSVCLAGCSGNGETSSNNPPDVAGTYSCVDGCSGVCTFDDELTVIQSGDALILRSDSFTDSVGTINNDGEFSTESDNCECEGQIISGTAIADCTCDGTNCQNATFEMQ